MSKQPGMDDWKKLYNAFLEIKDIAPWDWLDEDDNFTVQNPETGEIGFVSVMGTLGAHYAISVYRGEKGFNRFIDMSYSERDMFTFQRMIETPQLQASFENSDMLDKRDKNIIKQLSLAFKGKNSWPLFRSFKPGYVPWFLDLSELRFLLYALEQAKDVCLRAKEDMSILEPGDADTYLLRKKNETGKEPAWFDSTLKIIPQDPYQPEGTFEMFDVDKLKKMNPCENTLEIDFFMTPSAVKEKGSNPYYPYILLIIESDSGMIVGNHVLTPVPSLESMWKKIPNYVIETMIRLNLVPGRILISSELLESILFVFEDIFDIPVEFVEDSPNINEARDSFMKHMRGR